MVRSISSTLKTAQEDVSNTPYINLVFTSKDGNTTEDYSSDQKDRRILSIDHNEEPYNEYATITLRDNDRTIPNMKGYWTEIGYGYVANGNEYSKTSRLWIKHQQEVSMEGSVVTILELEGMWAKAKEILIRIGNPPYYRDENATLVEVTPYSVITTVLSELGMTLAALSEDDSIMNTYSIPVFELNYQPFESASGIIQRLLGMTKSYLRSDTGLEFTVKYPQSGDSVDLSYYSSQVPYFYEYTERVNTLVPNHIIVFANEGADGLWTDYITGVSKDQDEIDALYEVIQLAVAGEITNQADANQRAAAILTRMSMEAMSGRMFAPHDCRVELYDKVAIYDGR